MKEDNPERLVHFIRGGLVRYFVRVILKNESPLMHCALVFILTYQNMYYLQYERPCFVSCVVLCCVVLCCVVLCCVVLCCVVLCCVVLCCVVLCCVGYANSS